MRYPDLPRPVPLLVCGLLIFALLACGVDQVAGQESERIVHLLALEAGDTVADMGAGDGDWSADLLAAVGATGALWATEVDDDLVQDLKERFADHDNVRVVLGTDSSTGLPDDCCQAILLRLVYHHFTEPGVMRAALRRALQPGGRLLVIDIRPQEDWRQLEGVPDRGGHGITPEALSEEMQGDGFRLVERIEAWPGDEDRFALLFTAEP